MSNYRSEVQAGLLASFLNGRQLEFNQENVPSRAAYVRHEPTSKLLLKANLYTTEIHIDLNENIDKLYFCIRTPPQTLTAGQFFQYCDFPAIKMISRIEYYFNTYQNPVETYSTSSLYMQIFETLGKEQTWQQYVQDNLGGYDNSLVLGPCTVPEAVWVVPLPLCLLPLRVDEFAGSDNRLMVRIVLNPVRSFTYSSLNFTPADFIRSVAAQQNTTTSITSECSIFSQSSQDLLAALPGPKRCSDAPTDLPATYKTVQIWSSQTFSKSVAPKSEYFYAGNGALVNELTLFPTNPLFVGGQPFYGNYSINALVNFLNTCIYTYDTLLTSVEIVLNLRTGNATNLPTGWAISGINSTTYLFEVAGSVPARILLVSVGTDWASLSEDIYFDLGAFVRNANRIPVQLFKNLFFYVKQAALERVTQNGLVSPGGNKGFVEGLFLTQNEQLAIYGFQQIDFIDGMDEPATIFLRLAVAAPIAAGNALMSVFAKSKLVAINDPLFQHYDLDRTLRIGCNDLKTRYADLELHNDTLVQFSWSDAFFQDYAVKNKYATNNLRDMFRFMPSNIFTYNTPERPNGFLDCISNSLEIQFNIGLYDAATNREISQALTSPQLDGSSTLGDLIQSVYGSTFIAYEFVLKFLRFIDYKGRTLEIFTGDPELVSRILATFYRTPVDRDQLARTINVYKSRAAALDPSRAQKRTRLV